MIYLREDFEAPSRTDYYLMQIAALIEALGSKKGRKVTIDSKRLRFSPSSSPKMSKEQASAVSRAGWLGRVKMKPRTPEEVAEGLKRARGDDRDYGPAPRPGKKRLPKKPTETAPEPEGPRRGARAPNRPNARGWLGLR